MCPDLNDIERAKRDLKGHHLAHRTIYDVDLLETDHIHGSEVNMNRGRAKTDLCVLGWPEKRRTPADVLALASALRQVSNTQRNTGARRCNDALQRLSVGSITICWNICIPVRP